MPRGTQDTASVSIALRLRACHPLRMSFPEHSAILQCSYFRGPTTPTLTQSAKVKSSKEQNYKSLNIFLTSVLLRYGTFALGARVGLGSSPFARRY